MHLLCIELLMGCHLAPLDEIYCISRKRLIDLQGCKRSQESRVNNPWVRFQLEYGRLGNLTVSGVDLHGC
jgi:hypothetical protein